MCSFPVSCGGGRSDTEFAAPGEPSNFERIQLDSKQSDFPLTPLRQSYQRSRASDTAAQLRECIDLLENPELIVSEVLETFHAVDRGFEDGVLRPDVLAASSEQHIEHGIEPEWFYEGRDISTLGDSCSFTCLASLVEPLPHPDFDPKAEPEGFDYVGVTCNEKLSPLLGAVQSERDASAYPLLLRLLAGLAELAPPAQLERLNHQFFKGTLSAEPSFDLFLMVWEFSEKEDRTPLCQFTRDIAEVVKRTILEKSDFPGVLNDIVCLRMNPLRFDGRVRFDWRV